MSEHGSPVHVVFHLHCYQPPREDAWTGAVPVEPSAAPSHDWNHRVTDECYRPLRAARLLDDRGQVLDAVNLYRDVSVDVGPTLHRWLARHARDVDSAIVAADRDAAASDAGHGAAVAQPYVHAILPLASARDRTTLVRWGIHDFRRRFGREPEGMWLPEAAVDVDTLECLAAEGLRFTILGQHQAARVRAADGAWAAATGVLDPARLHVARLPSGRSLTICFYDGALSHAVAFDRDLLDDGTRLAAAVAARAHATDRPALVLLATDGETFGHHHRFGEMALARALHDLAAEPGITVGGLGAFVAAHASDAVEVEVQSPSAWSCAHGVERWRADCGDVTGGEPHWNQRWRAPLRAMVDLLCERAGTAYEAAAAEIVDDPWAVRDGYGAVVDDDLPTRAAYVRGCARDADADPATVTRLLGLLEAQRHLLFAQSSCAWFFADCAGIETAITLHHAARAVELLRTLTGVDLDPDVAAALAPMQSNDPAAGDGVALWRAAVAAAATPADVAAWWAAGALVGAAPDRVGTVRADVADLVTEGPPDRPGAVAATVTIVDEATGAVATVPVAARLDRWDVTIDADGRRALADLPRDARHAVLTAWWRRLADGATAPAVADVLGLLAATRSLGDPPDADLVEIALLRVAPAAVHAAADDPVAGVPDLDAVVAALPGGMPARLRWSAQNAVLAARDTVAPTMRARADANADADPDAEAWLAALARVAGRLTVALHPT